jgi:hypothetical protein
VQETRLRPATGDRVPDHAQRLVEVAAQVLGDHVPAEFGVAGGAHHEVGVPTEIGMSISSRSSVMPTPSPSYQETDAGPAS